MVIQTSKVAAASSGGSNTPQKTYFKSYWEVCHVLIKLLLYSFRTLQLLLASNYKIAAAAHRGF